MTPDAWFVGGIAAAALFLDFILHLIGGTWVLAKSRENLSREITEQVKEQRKEVDRDFIALRNEFSETFKAFRQGLTDLGKEVGRVELESYKTFVRRDSFYEVMNRQNELVGERLKTIETKFEKLDDYVRSLPQKLGSSTSG
jgi:hypothetical protein